MELFKAITICELTTDKFKAMKQSIEGIYSDYFKSLPRLNRILFLEKFKNINPICIDRAKVRDSLFQHLTE